MTHRPIFRIFGFLILIVAIMVILVSALMLYINFTGDTFALAIEGGGFQIAPALNTASNTNITPDLTITSIGCHPTSHQYTVLIVEVIFWSC